MENPILYVSRKRYTGESTVISMRLPKDMLQDIDDAAHRSGRTRNEIMSMSLEFALKHMCITPPDYNADKNN